MSESDQHSLGERFEVKHACPDCPSPFAGAVGGLARVPNPFCEHCRGTGLLTTEDLARWQAATSAKMAAGR